MNLNFGLIIALLFVWLILTSFFTTFTAGLAQFKGRSRAWGALGFLLNFIGFIIVCFLPSKREDGKETNPLRHFMSKMPSLSRKAIVLIVGLVIAGIVALVLYDRVPVMIQNGKYEKQVTKENMNTDQPKTLKADISDVFTGSESTYLITKDGDVHCFGRQLPASLDKKGTVIFRNAKKVLSTEKVCLVLDKSGSLYGMGNNTYLQLPTEEEDVYEFMLISDKVVDFSLSETTVGIIKEDGKLYMYGEGAHGQLGAYANDDIKEPTVVLGDVVAVECEATFTVALQKNGDVAVFGANDSRQFAKAESGFNYPVVIKNGIKEIAAGDGFIMLVDSAGNLFTCGANDCGQLGYQEKKEKEPTEDADKKQEAEDAPKAEDAPEAEAPAEPEPIPEFIQIMTGVDKIAADKKSAYALTADGTLYAWGQNTVGQLGNKNEKNQKLPVKVASKVKAFAASGLHTVIINSKNEVLSTGFNNCGQLGLGDARSGFSKLVTIK